MTATSKHGDTWTGEKQDTFYIYADKDGNLYESLEAPAYRINMDEAYFIPGVGIVPKEAKQ